METKKLYRSDENKVFAGVCGGMGEYFGIDPVIIRLIWAIVAICSLGTVLMVYIIAALIIPGRNGGSGGVGCAILLGVLILIPICLLVIFLVPFALSFFASWAHTFHNGFNGMFGFSPFGIIFTAVNGLVGIAFLGIVIYLIYLAVKRSR